MLINEYIGELEKTTVQTLNRLSQQYCKAAWYDEAVTGFEKVYAYRLKTLGADHPDTQNVLKELEAARTAMNQV